VKYLYYIYPFIYPSLTMSQIIAESMIPLMITKKKAP